MNDSFTYNINSKVAFDKLLSYSSEFFYHGVDSLYTYTQTNMLFDYRVWYWIKDFWYGNDSFNYIFLHYWFMIITVSSTTLFYSVLLDTHFFMNFFKIMNYFEFFKNNSNNFMFYSFFHPEIIYIYTSILNIHNNDFYSSLWPSLYTDVIVESFLNPIMYFPQLLFIFIFTSIIIIFLFSYYFIDSRYEGQVDSDYLNTSMLVESEKEIASHDDMLLALIILIYIFGCYFYIYSWSIIGNFPELVLFFYLFPWLYYIIIGIPTILIYDFGIFFLGYLRGVGSGLSLLVELMFDYIGVIIFYTRILVQGVRLVLMLFTYISMHDAVLEFSFRTELWSNNSVLLSDSEKSFGDLGIFSYLICFKLPASIFYWIYEIFHTFFVVTVQFIAFFAIVFWLFLFLYSFFVLEQQESYFFEKRKERKHNILKFSK